MKHGPLTGQSQSVDRDDEHDNAVEVAIVVQQEHSSPSTFTTTMIEVAVDDNENDNDNDVLVTSSSSHGRPNQYGLSPRQLRLLQAERRRRAAAATSSSSPSAVAASGTATAAAAAEFNTSIKCNNVPLALVPSPANNIRYSTPTKEKMPSSSCYYGDAGTPNKQQQQQHTNYCGSASGASTAELTEATTTASSSSIENGMQRRKKLQLGVNKLSSSTTTLKKHSEKFGGNHEHAISVVPVKIKDEDEDGRRENEDIMKATRVKVSDRIRAFNGSGPAGAGAVGVARWKRELAISGKKYSGNVSSANGEKSIDEAEELSKMTGVGPLSEQNGMKSNANYYLRTREGRSDMNQGNEQCRRGDSSTSTHVMIERQSLQHNKQHAMKELKKQQTPNSDGSGGHLKYYRVSFKGMVLLLPDLDCARRSHQQQQQHQQQHSDGYATVSTATISTAEHFEANSIRDISSETYIGYGDIVGTSSPEIILPMNTDRLLAGDVHTADDTCTKSGKQATHVKAIRVDAILTGGYVSTAPALPDPNLALRGVDSECATICPDFHINETASIESHHRHQHHQHFGYILLSDDSNLSIAEPLSTATANTLCSSCKRGSFIYRVIASSPVPVLSGPSIDAIGLGMGLLPGTVHEVSLRISVPLSAVKDNDDNTNTLVDDADASEVQFLRLARRRGWVADRTVEAIDQKLRVLYHMRIEPSDYSHGGVDRSNALINSSLSMNFEDTFSLNSSTGANASYYSSVVASSVATPASVKIRRRRNRRPRAGERDIKRTQALSISSIVQHTQRIGESFEEAGSAVTGDGSSEVAYHVGDGSSMLGEGYFQSAKRIYLMRVIAPLGLKILDTTDFQVSTLIHSPSLNAGDAWSSSISPFSRTNAMICSSSSADISSSTTTVRKGNTARVRCFTRGQIFEACQRMDVSSESNLYTNGNGLIKLADGSGWAIVPHHDDLMAQFRSTNDRPDIELAESTNGIVAYEEIGNALVVSDYTISPPQLTQPNREDIESGRLLKDIVWLRVVAPPNGTRILLPPSRQQPSIANGQLMKTESHATLPKKAGHDKLKPSSSCESEAASMVSGSFLDAVWNRITPTKESKRDHTMCHHPIIPVIPCGMVVPVEPWDRSTNPTKCFSRLFNGQGWIPRRLGEEIFSYEVHTPDIRVGSFWFRVSSRSGVDVRQGPSVGAAVIESRNGAPFRFECGEFLRASDVITVFEKSNPDWEGVGATATECYAKLFRRSNHPKENDSSRSLLDQFSSLEAFAPGEWVQVHGRGELFLEECSAAPTIVRNRDGLRYTMTVGGEGLHVYSGPSLQANVVGKLNLEGNIFLVTEKVTVHGEEESWLRLKSGGWICNVGANGKSVVQALRDEVPT